eukprot:14873382-Alexandrium_andersonii.AAC.1
MSASLVGSEMCIRDRLRVAVPTLGPPTGTTSGGRARRSPGASRRRRLGPVSYTHLTLPTICSV